MTTYDYSQLRGTIITVFGSNKNCAKAMGMTPQALSSKLNNKTEFTQSEISCFSQLANLDANGILANFFCQSN